MIDITFYNMPTATKTKNTDTKSKAVHSASTDIFKKIQEKTGISKEKIDKFQEEWIKMPKTRTKYKHLQDAPKVVGEELFAMTNDIIDFVEGEHGGKSHVFQAMKKEGKSFFKSPVDYIRGKVDKGVDAIVANQKALKKNKK